MDHYTTRRDFLGSAAAIGGWMAAQGWRPVAPAMAEESGTSRRGATIQPVAAESVRKAAVAVVTHAVTRDVQPRAGAWPYIAEVLQRAGVFFTQLPPEALASLPDRRHAILLLAGDLPLVGEQREAVAAFVRNGGAVIGIGGTSGLDEVFGVSGLRPVAEGWLKVTADEHPIAAGLRSSLHVFGGFVAKTTTGTSLATLESGPQASKGSAIVENRYGQGRAILLAADLLFSIVHIQQGIPVLQDARPPADDSAATNDGILKAEDGLVLDWQRDRQAMQPEGVPAFLEPVSDELREIILRSVFHAAREQRVALGLLWYWPRGLKAIGHVSHDTDGHDPTKAVAMLEHANRCDIKTTWCTLYPGGYPREFYRTLQEQGFEVALHYDAMTGEPQTSWSKENLILQHQWLLAEAGLKHITSNKNHYTRWENRLDFYHWCEELGIHTDQTRGPSKKGTIGFPLGGSQPYFPIDDESDSPRLMDVLEVNLLTQDLAQVCPAEYGPQLVDATLRHHGVAHFLFHPGHILKPPVAEAMQKVVEYGRECGLEWWTSEQLYRWEMLRRGASARFDSATAWTLHAPQPIREATLLFLRVGQQPTRLQIHGQAVQGNPWTIYGFEFDAVTTDLSGDVTVEVVR